MTKTENGYFMCVKIKFLNFYPLLKWTILIVKHFFQSFFQKSVSVCRCPCLCLTYKAKGKDTTLNLENRETKKNKVFLSTRDTCC